MAAKQPDPKAAERLAVLEDVFETCAVAWGKAEAALGEILRDKLWRAGGYRTESDYLRRRWNIAWGQAYRKKRAAKVAAVLGDDLPEGVREAHLACLVGYEPELQRKILKTAAETAPDGKLTAAWVEQTARRLSDELKAALRQQKDAPAAAADQDDEDDPEGDAADPKPPKRQAKRTGQDPIVAGDAQEKLIRQAVRQWRKLDRAALALSMTPEDLVELVRDRTEKEAVGEWRRLRAGAAA